MTIYTAMIAFGGALGAISLAGPALAAPNNPAARQQTTVAPATSQSTAALALNTAQVSAASNKNSKNCGKGNNNGTGNGNGGQNNGNCPASP